MMTDRLFEARARVSSLSLVIPSPSTLIRPSTQNFSRPSSGFETHNRGNFLCSPTERSGRSNGNHIHSAQISSSVRKTTQSAPSLRKLSDLPDFSSMEKKDIDGIALAHCPVMEIE
jgi:hypothetical protein